MALVATLQMVSVCGHAQRLRVAQGRQGVGGLAALGDGDHQRLRVGHRFAVAVFTGHLDLRRDLRDRLQPVLGGAAAVVAGAAGQDQHLVDGLEHPVRAVAEQLGHDALHAFERVGDGARLLEDFLLHVVPVGAQLGRAAVGLHRLHRPLHRPVGLVDDPVAAQLQVHHVAFLQIDDLVGHAGQRHRVAGQEVLAMPAAHAQDQRRAGPRAHHAVRLVLVEHGNGVGALQLLDRRLDRVEQVAVVQAVDQVRRSPRCRSGW
jgi:hypothetical protein